MPASSFAFLKAESREICEQFAAETEAVVFLTENYGDEEIHSEIPGLFMRAEVISLAEWIRFYGCRIRVNGVNGGIVYAAL